VNRGWDGRVAGGETAGGETAPAKVPGKTPLTSRLSASSEPSAGDAASKRVAQPADDALVAVHPDDSWLLLPTSQAARAAAVQRRGRDSSDADTIHAAAARGVATQAAPLPHRDALEAGFGQDLSGVTAHVGGDAAATADAMGAEAYAAGDHVVLPEAPSLHTTAHEVAHVLQQRGGVSLLGGVGSAGDPYERDADAVADRIVAGDSGAAPGRTGLRGPMSRLVQRKEKGAEGTANEEELHPMLEASIRAALAIPVPSGNLEAARIRLIMLEAHFRALHRPNRRSLLRRLEEPGDDLARQFRHRLSTASRQRLLAILRDDTPAATEAVATAQDAGTEAAVETNGEQKASGGAGDDIYRAMIGEASTAVGKMARVSAPAGLRLRTRPAGDGDTLVIMPFDTLVHVDRQTEHGWCYVHALGGARDGGDASGTGFCERNFLVLDPPEPGAHLHRVAGGEMLKDIAAAHYKPAGGFREGSDARLYVEAIYEANRGRDHAIRRVGDASLGLVDAAARSDAEEKTVRIFQTVQVVAGQSIWLPSAEMIQALRDAGAITGGNVESVWSAAKNALGGVWDGAQQLAGFYVGLLEGAFGAVKDLVMGIVDLLEMLYDLVKSLWEHGFVGTCQRLWKFCTDLWDNKGELAAKFGAWFMNGWCNDDPFDRGRFQGEVIGYVAMTILLIIATAGAGAAAQAGGKFGTVIKAIRVLSSAGDIGTYTGAVSKGIKTSKHLRRALGAADDALDAAGDAADTAADVARRVDDVPSQHVDAPTPRSDTPGVEAPTLQPVAPDVDAPSATGANVTTQPEPSGAASSSRLDDPVPAPVRAPQVTKLDSSRFRPTADTPTAGTVKKVLLVDSESGKRFLWKPVDPDASIPVRADELGITPASLPGRAKASEVVADRLDIDTPRVEIVEYEGKVGSLQEWREVARTTTLIDLRSADPAAYARVLASPEYQRLRSDLDALDHVLDNLDRNDGNLFIELDDAGKVSRITAIDHDYTLTASTKRYVDELGTWARALPDRYSRTMYENLKRITSDPESFRRALASYVTESEAEAAIARARQVTADIEAKVAKHGEANVFFGADDAAQGADLPRRADAPSTGPREGGPGSAPRGRTPEQLRELEAQLPPELRGEVAIVDGGGAVTGSGVHVSYRGGSVRIEVGPDAQPRHVAYHAQTARLLLRYQGPLGQLRRLLDAIRSKLRLTPGYGTEGFVAREEVRKLMAIQRELLALQQQLDDRARSLELADLSKVDADTLNRELSAATEQLEEHLRKIDSYEPGRGFIAAEGAKDIVDLPVPVSQVKKRIPDETSTEWVVHYKVDGPDGKPLLLGMSVVPLGADGRPSGTPEFVLEKRHQVEGQNRKVQLTDDSGERVSLTGWALDDTILLYKDRFGHTPRDLGGLLADDNKLNFQREFARAQRADPRLPDEQAAQVAIRKISFGSHRADRGYDDFTVTLSEARVMVDLGSELGVRSVPAKINVSAKKREP
jgi:hypothetical protein